MFRVALALSIVLWLAPTRSAAQSTPYSPPPRLQRPAPSAAYTGFLPSPAAALRLQTLQLSLSDLAQREGARFWPASLQLAVGVGFGTAAVFVHDPGLRAVFSLGAAVSGLRGILQFSFNAHVERELLAFSAIGINDRVALWSKMRTGEHALAQAARVARTQRILEGCLGVLGAAAFLPVQYAFAREHDHSYRFGRSGGDYAGLSLALIGLAGSLVQAIRKSPAELRYDAYRTLRRSTMHMR